MEGYSRDSGHEGVIKCRRQSALQSERYVGLHRRCGWRKGAGSWIYNVDVCRRWSPLPRMDHFLYSASAPQERLNPSYLNMDYTSNGAIQSFSFGSSPDQCRLFSDRGGPSNSFCSTTATLPPQSDATAGMASPVPNPAPSHYYSEDLWAPGPGPAHKSRPDPQLHPSSLSTLAEMAIIMASPPASAHSLTPSSLARSQPDSSDSSNAYLYDDQDDDLEQVGLRERKHACTMCHKRLVPMLSRARCKK